MRQKTKTAQTETKPLHPMIQKQLNPSTHAPAWHNRLLKG